MKGAKVRVEPKPFTQQTYSLHYHNGAVKVTKSHSLHYHNGAVKVTKSTFYSNHITLAGSIATSFLKSKALLNTDWEK